MAIKYYLKQNVYNAALERINRIFDEFTNVWVCISGGKDSTVVYNLAMIVAERKNRLPLDVMFIDQEAEWEHTIQLVRKMLHDPRVRAHWYQMPIKIFNAASHISDWLHCWAPGEEWMRDKEPDSIHENVYNQDRFHELFGAIFAHEFPNEPAAYLAGVRAAEAPKRTLGLTTGQTYKDITWGTVESKKLKHYTFYPLYDWGNIDVWKAINDNGWEYNKIYDYQFSAGIPITKMRVSNLHHETALESMRICQEFEPETWNKLLKRIDGANSVRHLQKDSMAPPQTLPFMFESWKEYRDYLLDNLVSMEDAKKRFKARFERMDESYSGMEYIEDMYKAQILSILVNDYYMTRIDTWEVRPEIGAYRKYKRSGQIMGAAITHRNKYIFGESK